MNDIKQTSQWANFFSKTGWKSIKIGKNYLYIRKLPIIGSYMRVIRPTLPINFDRIEEIACSHRVLIAKIDPKITLDDPKSDGINNLLIRSGFRQDHWTETVTKTLILDLRQSKEKLLKGFRKTTRYNIKLAQKKKIYIKKSSDLNLFYPLYQATAQKKGFSPLPFDKLAACFKAFEQNQSARLLLAMSTAGKLLGGCLILYNRSESKAYYYLAASLHYGENTGAMEFLVWQAILLAKKERLRFFDFDGIFDPRFGSSETWAGTTFFKQGFKGKEVTYLGAYLKAYNPVLRIILYLISKFFRGF